MLFLQILGGIFLVVLLVAAWYGWKILRFFKRIKSGDFTTDVDRVCSLLPATEVSLEASDINEWQEKDTLFETENKMRTLGCEHLGYFVTYQELLTIQLSLWNFKNSALFVIYEAVNGIEDEGSATFIVECAAKLANGKSITITSNEGALLLPRPPHHLLFIEPTLDPKKLISMLKPKLTELGKPQKITNAQQFFCDTAEDIASWVWSEQQLRSEAFRTFLEHAGVNLEEFDFDELVEYGSGFRSELITRKITRKVSQNPKISAAKWEEIRDKLVVIHEDMDKASFVASLYDLCINLSEAQEEMLEELEESDKQILILDELEKLKKPLSEVFRAKKIGQVSDPVPAHIYVRP